MPRSLALPMRPFLMWYQPAFPALPLTHPAPSLALSGRPTDAAPRTCLVPGSHLGSSFCLELIFSTFPLSELKSVRRKMNNASPQLSFRIILTFLFLRKLQGLNNVQRNTSSHPLRQGIRSQEMLSIDDIGLYELLKKMNVKYSNCGCISWKRPMYHW